MSLSRTTLTAVLTPARLGTNHVRLRLTTTNAPYHPVQLTATLTQDAAGIGPLPLALHRTSQGTYQSAPISLGFRGTWTLTAVIRSDAFDLVNTSHADRCADETTKFLEDVRDRHVERRAVVG